MGYQFSTAIRNARADAVESTIGTTPTLEIRTGAAPADCAAADSGTLLATLTLPSDWLTAASGGAKAKAGTWSGSVTGTGTAGHFRIKASGGAVGLQGSVSQRTEDGGTGDMKLAQATAALVAGQTLTVDTFTLAEDNA